MFFHQLLDMKIFVDTDSDIRLVRRLRRDITERGRDIEGVIKQYNKFVKPAFEQYIEPTMRLADIVVPRGENIHTEMCYCYYIALKLNVQLPFIHIRWRQHGGHRFDRSARPQSVGGGKKVHTCKPDHRNSFLLHSG